LPRGRVFSFRPVGVVTDGRQATIEGFAGGQTSRIGRATVAPGDRAKCDARVGPRSEWSRWPRQYGLHRHTSETIRSALVRDARCAGSRVRSSRSVLCPRPGHTGRTAVGRHDAGGVRADVP
jgi:hypothetical protein